MSNNSHFSRLLTKTLGAGGLVLAGFAAFAADFPTGTYSIDATTAHLTFDGQGQFRVLDGDKLQVSGAYTAKGDQIQLTDKEGPWACTKEGQQSGTYRWKYDKSVLTFSKISDACEARVGSLAPAKWTRQS